MLSSLNPATFALASTNGHETKQQESKVNVAIMDKTQLRGKF